MHIKFQELAVVKKSPKGDSVMKVAKNNSDTLMERPCSLPGENTPHLPEIYGLFSQRRSKEHKESV